MKILFDIGGTNMRISSVVDGKLGKVVKFQTPTSLQEAKELIIRAVGEISNGEKIESIVLGIPGVVKDGVVTVPPSLKSWGDFDIGSFLRENFCEKVAVFNDTALAGLGESLYGAGKGNQIVAYIGIGTGVGGVRIVNGSIDAHRFGFEPGHHIVDMSTGKAMDAVSGLAIYSEYGKKAEELGPEKIRELTPILAAGLYNAIVFWSPDVLVTGGSLMNEETAYRLEDVKQAIEEVKKKMNIPEMKIMPEIRKAELGDNSGLYGALAMTERI